MSYKIVQTDYGNNRKGNYEVLYCCSLPTFYHEYQYTIGTFWTLRAARNCVKRHQAAEEAAKKVTTKVIEVYE